MRNCQLIVLTLLAAYGMAASGQDRVPVTSIKPLLIAAAKYGEAHGTLVGQHLEMAQKQFGTDTPILIDVRSVKTLAQASCKRLKVTTTQAGVQQRDKKTGAVVVGDQKLEYEISFCEDGGFPSSGPEVSRAH